MEEAAELKELVAETGRMLLDQGLVARTWGNVSARINQETYAITPSGLDYRLTEPEDIAVVSLADGSWKGRRKPSGERGIHAAAYEALPGVNFVIHTHQNYATALGLGGFDNDKLTPEEREILGTVTTAGYALPGTKALARNVLKHYLEGSRVVLMAHHGAVICGTDRDDAFRKATLLEEVCKRQLRGMDPDRPAAEQFAALGLPLKIQLDDMAQIMGKKIRVVPAGQVLEKVLMKYGALIEEGKTIRVAAKDAEEEETLRLLTEKAAISALHTRAIGKESLLSNLDVWLMRAIYRGKYSKQIKG